MTKQFSAPPVDVLQHQRDVPESTLFGAFSEDIYEAPSSPTSSILSPPEEVTQHTILEDDIWEHADSQPTPSNKINTWESFGAGRRNIPTRVNPFATEQNPEIFDELLKMHMDHIYSRHESGITVDEYLFREV